MATKKQQRRKYQRSLGRGRLYDGYEPKETEGRPERRSEPRRRGPREPARPTWARSARRAGIFAIGLFLFMTVLQKAGTAVAAVQAAAFLVFLVPFGYLMDSFVYNRWLKRQG